MVHLDKAPAWGLPLLAVVVALALAACGGASGDAVDPACAGLEAVSNRDGLISRSEAVEQAMEYLASSAPEVTGMEIERVVAGCLTTLRSYHQDLLEGRAWTDPEVRSPDMPVWVVELKGISRPAGISAVNADAPYLYGMAVYDARSGEPVEGSRHRESMLELAPEE